MQTATSLHALSQSIESHSIEFYKTCVLKTNQFSTKYILQRLIEHHKTHTKKLAADLTGQDEELLDAGLLEKYRHKFDREKHLSAGDIENLNFVEAAKLAIWLIRFQIDYYRGMAAETEDHRLQEGIALVIGLKSGFIDELRVESERLSYDNK